MDALVQEFVQVMAVALQHAQARVSIVVKNGAQIAKNRRERRRGRAAPLTCQLRFAAISLPPVKVGRGRRGAWAGICAHL
jgi:hypothetical protein